MSRAKRSIFSFRGLLITAAAVLVAALVAVTALSHFAVPWARQELRGWAAQHGYDHAEINGVSIRLFPLRVSLSELRLDAGGARILEVAEAGIEISLIKLLAGDQRIDSVRLNGADIRLNVTDDGIVSIAGLRLGGEGKRVGESASGARSEGGKFPIKALKVRDSSLRVTAPNLEMTIHVSDLELKEGREVTAGVMEFRGLRLTIVHNADDTWDLQAARGEESATLGTGAKAEAGGLSKAASSLSFSLDRIAISDDSTVTFRQEAPGEEYETTYRIDRAFIDDIRSDRPDGESKFACEATSNRHERILLEGEAELFGKPPEFSVTGSLEGLELVPFNPFMKRAAGFVIDSGQADGSIDVEAREGKIEGLVDVRVNLLTVSTADKAKLKEFEKTLPKQIKLSTAIRLLSNKKGVVWIKIPVSGDATAPTFDLDLDLSNAISNALGEIVKTGLLVAAPWAVATKNALFAKRPPSRDVSFAPLSDVLDENVNLIHRRVHSGLPTPHLRPVPLRELRRVVLQVRIGKGAMQSPVRLQHCPVTLPGGFEVEEPTMQHRVTVS